MASDRDLPSLGRYRNSQRGAPGPRGVITDDTQLTMCVGASICATGYLDPEDLARRFAEWLPSGRGMGAATVKAVSALAAGATWDRAGVTSGGNGAAMRVAPIGLRYPVDLNALRRDSALSALITHATPRAVLSAISQAFMAAFCQHRNPGDLTANRLRSGPLSDLEIVMDGVLEEAVPERRADRPGVFRLRDRLAEANHRSFATAGDPFEYFHNGGFERIDLPEVTPDTTETTLDKSLWPQIIYPQST